MENPEEHYYGLAERIFNAEYYAYGDEGEVDKDKFDAYADYLLGKGDNEPEWTDYHERLRYELELGFDDLCPIIESVIEMDRCFSLLLKNLEPLGALALVRIQVDNLKHIYAETKYPGLVLHNIYGKGRELNQIKVGGKAINATELITELDTKYGRVRDIWKTYCLYVHPSREQTGVGIASYYSYLRCKRVPYQKAIKYFSWDMVYINMLITNVLFSYLDSLVEVLKSKHNYWKYLREVRNMTY